MTETANADGPLLLRPDMKSSTDLPEHLKGSRSAIFHLLRVRRAQQEMTRRPAVSSAPPAPARPKPRISRDQGTASDSARNPLWQGFFVEDQFEFLAAETRLKA